MLLLPGLGGGRRRDETISAPVFTVDPALTGITTVGEVLSVTAGVVVPTPQTIAFEWYRGTDLVPGAREATYRLTTADIGLAIKAKVIAVLNEIQTEKFTAPSALIKAAEPPETVPVFTAKPTINGVAMVGNTLTGGIGEVAGFPAPTLTYRWTANGTPISGATAVTYTLTTGELGKVIRFEVKAVNSEAPGGVIGLSDPTAAVVAETIPDEGYFALYTNIGGMETGDAWSGFTIRVPNSTIDSQVAKGINKFRFTLDGSKAQPELFGDLDPVYMGYIRDDIVNYCASKGAKAVLDLHNFGKRSVQLATATPVFTDADFSNEWSTFNATARVDGVIENTANNAHQLSRTFNAAQGYQVVKVEVQAGSKPWLRVTQRGATDYSALIDFTAGALVTNPSQAWPTSVTSLGDGWYEVTVKTPLIAARSMTILLEPGNASADYASFVSTGRIYTGDGASQPFKIRKCTVTTENTVRKGLTYGTPELPFSAFYDWWFKFAGWIIANCNLDGLEAFEGMNEPYSLTADACFQMHTQGIKACYDAGWRGAYYVSGIPWQNGPTFWAYNPNLHLLPNPGLKLIFSAHGYADRDSSGTHFGPAEWGQDRAEGPPGAVTDVDVLIDRYRPFVEGCEARGVIGSVGECGIDMTGGPTSIACFQKTVDYLKLHKIHWYVWASGPIWPASYAYSLENRANGLQAPGMVVFDDYYLNPAPTKFSIEGPGRLDPGETEAVFTITYNGRLTSTKTITLSDNGGGGTFTPSSVVLPIGANAVETVTYTPNGEQLVKITASASGWTEVTGGFDFTSESDMLDDLGIDARSAENIIDWQVQRIATFKGPIAQFARDSDQATYDAIPVGQGYNSANVGAEPDWAAIVAWAGGPFRLKWAYNQGGKGAAGHSMGPATNEGRTPAFSELPIMVQDNGGKWYPAFTTATRMRLDSDMGVKGQVISFTTKYTSGSGLIQWGFTNTSKTVMPCITNTWLPNTNVVSPTNTVPNERGDMPLAVKTDGWHVYTERWTCALSATAERADGWKTWCDDELVGVQNSGAVSLNVDYSRDDATMGFNRTLPGIGSYTGLVGPIYIFRDTTSSLDVLPDETAVAGLITQQVADHDIAPPAFDDFSHIRLDFKNDTYKVDGVNVALTDLLTGTHSRDGAGGLLVNSTTGTKSAAGALLAALQSKEFVIRIKTTSISGAADGDSFRLITFNPNLSNIALLTGTAGNWLVSRLAVQTMTGMGNTGSADRFLVGAPHTLQVSQAFNKQFQCQAPTTPVESAFTLTSAITRADFFTAISATWGDIRIASIEVSATPFRSAWNFIDKMREDYIGPVGPVNPHDLRLGVNLGTFLNITAGDPAWVYAHYLNRRAKTFRLTLNWDGDPVTGKPGLQPVASGPLNQPYINAILAAVNRILDAGGEAILDCHEFGANLNADSTRRTTADFVDLWSKLTAAMPKSPRVGYCLMNEPNSAKGPGGVAITKLQYTTDIEQPAINAIRAAGGIGPIHVSIYGTYTAASSAASYADDKKVLVDPLDNLVLEVHEYFSSDGGGGDNNAVMYKATAQAVNVIRWARENGWTLFFGEIGMGNSTSGGTLSFTHAQETFSFYKLVSAHRDVVRGVAAWTGGRLQSAPPPSDAADYIGTYGGSATQRPTSTYIYSHDPRMATNSGGAQQPAGYKINMAALMRWSQSADLATQAPYFRVAPTISGSAIQGQVLTCNPGEADRAERFEFLWLQDGVAIVPNVTTDTYLLVADDVSHKISCRVTAISDTNSNQTTVVSGQTIFIQPAAAPAVPKFETAPSITAGGPLTSGTVLTLNDGLISGYPSPTLARKWFRNGTDTGITASTYTLAAVDAGKTIYATVTAVNSQAPSGVVGTSNTLTIPDVASTAVTFTPGTERNLSALSGDLGQVYELTSVSDPTNAARQVLVGRHAPTGSTASQVLLSSGVWYTNDNWATCTVQLLPSESEPTVACDHLGNFFITTSGSSDYRIRRIPAGSGVLGPVKIIGSYLDRTHVHVDTSPTSPFQGRIYCGGRAGFGGLRIHRSDDLGVTFANTLITGDADFNVGFLYGITTAPDGTVYATYSGRNNTTNPYTGSSQNHWCVKSEDGGVTWTLVFIFKNQETTTSGNGVGWRSWSGNIAVNPVSGRLHVMISQGASAIQQRQYLTSDDKGDTWTDHGFLNLTLPSGWGPGHHHLAANAQGHLCLQFYAVNSAYTSIRKYVIGSKNDGVTWNGLTKVNSVDFPMASPEPRAIIGEDRTYGNANADGTFNVIWQRPSTNASTYAAWLRPVTLS